MASHDEKPGTKEMQICQGNNAAPDSQLLGTTANSEPEVKIEDGSSDKIDATKETETYRSNLWLTFWMFCSFADMGLLGVVMGPSFLDLLELTNSNVAEGSAIMTVGSAGFISGALFTGVFSKPFSYKFLISVSLAAGGAFNIFVPWCTNLILLCSVNFVQCFFNGVACTVTAALCLDTWRKDSGIYMQAIHLGYALGAFGSPLIVKPFLSPRPPTANQTTTSSISSSNFTVSTISSMNSTLLQTTEFMPNISNSNSSLPELPTIPETQVHYAFLIIGILSILTAIPFGFYSCKTGIFHKGERFKKEEEGAPLKFKDIILPIFLILSLYMVFTGMEDGVSIFLTTFTVRYLNWSKQDGSMATFVFWLCFAIGRFVGIFILKFFTVNQTLMKDLLLLNISFFILIWSKSLPILLWIFIGVSGYAIAGVYPTGYAWIETYLFKATAQLCSAISITSSVGISINPLFIGFMIENYSPIWYTFILFGESLVCTGVVLAMFFFSKSQYWQNKRKLTETVSEDTNRCSCMK